MLILLFYTFFLNIVVMVIGQRDECAADHVNNNYGTVLFTAADEFKQCWSPDEIATLTARMIMEDLLPDISILNIDSSSYVEDIVGYFRLLIEVVKKSTHGRKKHITLLVLTDLLGSYLQYAVLPIARHAFYAGLIDYNCMEKLIQLFEEIKWFLRTNGQGWSRPLDTVPDTVIEQIDLEAEAPKVKSCCNQLIFYEYEHRLKEQNHTIVKSDIAFPLPFFDTNVRPSSIALPFRKYALRNIESRRASYFIMKYFIAALQCLDEKSSSKEARVKFQNTFYTWLVKYVCPKLKDDKFYSAFGGVLRVEETLKAMGAVLHLEKVCPADVDEEMTVPDSGTHRSFTSTVVLITMLVIIFIWFIIGTVFICLRMRRNHKKDSKAPPRSDFTTCTDDSKWSLPKSRSDSKPESSIIGICKCSSRSTTTPYSSSITSEYEIEEKIKKKRIKHPKDKTVTICYPPFMAPYLENNKPAVIETKTIQKKLPSIEEITEGTVNRKHSRDSKVITNTSKSDTRSKKTTEKYPPNEIAVPCKYYDPTLSGSTTKASKTSHESLKKKIKPGMTIEECWCDILQDEDIENGIDSDKSKKTSRKPSVEFSLENLDRESISKRPSKEQTFHNIESLASSNKYGKGTPVDGSTVGESQRSEHLTERSHGEEGSIENSIHESTDDTSGVTEKEGTSPHTYACHSSLTGNYTAEGRNVGKPYIYGYDFQSSTSSDLSDDDTDIKTSTSK